MNKVNRICPICGCSTNEVLHKQKFMLLEYINFMPNTVEIVSCDKCGFIYDSSKANQDTYNKYYSIFNQYEKDRNTQSVDLSEYDVERFKNIVHKVKPYINREANIIDIGCSNGGLLQTFKSEGYNNITGLDMSYNCVEYTKSLNIECWGGGIFSLPEQVKRRKYDFIILSQVLEHIFDLQQAICNIKSLLSNNGLLYIEVPNAEKYLEYFISPYHYFGMEHINHFDLISLCNLILKNQFSIIDSGESKINISKTAIYPVIYIISKNNIINIEFMVKKSNLVNSIKLYIIKSKNLLADIDLKLKRYIKSYIPVAVWGVGSYTMDLLTQTELSKCNIEFFIDSDEKKQGSLFNGIKILSPEHLKNFKYPIIVSSACFTNEIKAQIKEMKLDNEIVSLN